VVYSVPYDVNAKYSWLCNDEILNDTTNQLTVKYVSGNYQAIVTSRLSETCTSSSIIKTVTLNSKPSKPEIYSSLANNTICQDDSILIHTSVSGLTNFWFPEGIGTTNTQTITVKSRGRYRLVTYNGKCYSDTSNVITVTVDPKPEMPLLSYGTTTFCQGDSVIFTNNDYNAALYTYRWLNDANPLGDEAGMKCIAKQNGNYRLEVKLGNCAIKTTPVQVKVNETPIIPTFVYDQNGITFCDGGSLQLSTQPFTGTYTWLKDQVAMDDHNDTITVYQSGTYKLKAAYIYNNLTCETTSTQSVVVTNNPNPLEPTILAIGETTFCQGDSVKLHIDEQMGVNYYWHKDNSPAVYGNNANEQIINENGVFNAVARNSSTGCESISKNSVSVTVNSMPEKPVVEASGETTICEGTPLNFSFTIQDGVNYQWYRFTNTITNETNDTLK
jgi:hypothetical protein